MTIITTIIEAIVKIVTALIGRHSEGVEICSLTTKDLGTLDVKIRNTSPSDAIITEIKVAVVKHSDAEARTVLSPSEGYKIPINDLRKGQSKSIQISHLVEANKADRFLVFLDTTRLLKVKLTLAYNRDRAVSKSVWLKPA